MKYKIEIEQNLIQPLLELISAGLADKNHRLASAHAAAFLKDAILGASAVPVKPPEPPVETPVPNTEPIAAPQVRRRGR